MKASILTQFGPPEVLQIREVAKPRPGDRDVLIRVRATPVSFGDTLVRDFAAVTPAKFNMPGLFWLIGKMSFGFRKPRVSILGSEFAGEVEAVGKRVTRFKKGDAVFGYLRAAHGRLRRVPVHARGWRDLGEAGEHDLRAGRRQSLRGHHGPGPAQKIRLQPGQSVLVVGASGGIGPAVVQLARHHFGARVAGVCGTARVDYVKSLGADTVIDYTRENFLDRPETYDVIIDILGKSPFSRCRRILEPHGRLILSASRRGRSSRCCGRPSSEAGRSSAPWSPRSRKTLSLPRS